MPTYKSIRYLVPDEVVEHTDSINALADVNTSTVSPEVGQTLKWSAANSRWQPADIEESGGATQKAIFGFGDTGSSTNVTNLVSSSGVVASDTTGVGTAKRGLAASSYGGDKALFGFGMYIEDDQTVFLNETNLVSNTGVVATDTTGVGTSRDSLAAAGFGGDKAIFGFGNDNSRTNITNLVSNAGVVASDTTGVGTAKMSLAAAGFGGDKAIFGFGGDNSGNTNITNLVSNTGVVATDTTGVGTSRDSLAAAGFGGDKAIFGFGSMPSGPYRTNLSNLVSSSGVVASDTTGVGTARKYISAAGFGGDKAIFGFGLSSGNTNITNLVSNTGVVASDTTGIGTARRELAAAGYSTTA